MKKITLILLIGLSILSCTKNEKIIEGVIEGDLYFKLIDIGSFYGKDDKTIKSFEKYIDSIRWSKIVSKDDLEIIRVYDLLKKNHLLKSPWINIQTESDIKRIYLNEKKYLKIEKFDRNELINENKKVSLKVLVKELDSGIYYLDKISELKVVEGKTYWRK